MSTIQRITSKYFVDSSFPFQDLPRDSEPYVEVASVNQFGLLLGAGLLFNNRSIVVKCEVDGEQIFEVSLSFLRDMFDQGEDSIGANLPFYFDDQKDLFTFKPTAALMFRDSIKFFARSSTNSSSRDFEGAIIEYTRE